MNISSFIARRIAFNQQKSFSRFIIRLSIAATIISVMAMIITLSFLNGFQQAVSNKVFSFWGHIRISARQPMQSSISEEEPIEANASLAKKIQQMPEVKSIHPFATKNAILKTSDELEGVMVKGLDSSFDTLHLQSFMKQGRWIRFHDSSYSREIIISTFIANQLHLKLNDRVLIYFIKPDGSLRPDKLTIVGIYKTGIDEYDQRFAICDLKLIQRLNSWTESEIGGYEIFLNDYKQMNAVSNTIFNRADFPDVWNTQTAQQLSPNIFDWLNAISMNSTVLLIITTVIALINLITCLIILVLERLRMIGILKALGASNWTVQKIFLHQSAIVTITGIAAGLVLSLALLWLQQKTGIIHLPEDAYYIDKAEVKIDWWEVALVTGGTLFVSLIVLLIPSFLVRRIQPIRAIRFS